MSTTEGRPHTPDFPRDRISNVSTSVQIDAGTRVGKPRRAKPSEVFRDMPFLVKLSAIWLLLVVFGAIYAKLDQTLFNGSLPLQDPNLQTNKFNPDTGESEAAGDTEAPAEEAAETNDSGDDTEATAGAAAAAEETDAEPPTGEPEAEAAPDTETKTDGEAAS